LTVALVVLGAWAAGLVVGAYAAYGLGKRAGVLAMDARLEDDQPYRQLVLGRLARLEGATVEVRE
jgi:hypothetical protein